MQELESRNGKVIYIKILNQVCYIKHANRSATNNYYFGFAQKDIEQNNLANKAILLCGKGRIEHIFVLDFKHLTSIVCEMMVTHRRRAPIDMNLFRVQISEIEQKLI